MSRRIHAPFTGRGGSVYTANQEREGYMKTWFRTHLERSRDGAGHTPKVFLKFGANHVQYGHSPTHVLTLGTFVRELAWAGGQRTFNLHVDCSGGKTRDPRSGETPDCGSYFLGSGSSIARYHLGDRITLIDLASLRTHSRLWKEFDEKSKRLIRGCDAFLSMPDPRPAGIVGK